MKHPSLVSVTALVMVVVMGAGWSPMTGSKTGWEVCLGLEIAVPAQKDQVIC